MKRNTKYIKGTLTLLFILATTTMWAQNETATTQGDMLFLELQSRLQLFLDDWNDVVSDIQYGSSDDLPDTELRMQQLDAKWTTYSQAQLMDIANDEDLLEIVGNIQTVKQTADEQLAKKKAELHMQDNFKNAEVFINNQDSVYRQLSKTAAKMALVKQMAAQLEKLKAKEQLLFADIQTHYTAAKEAAEAIPTLQERMKKLEEHYIILKSVSEKIQTATYQPWITRIKDYLLGLAAVSVLLMFFSMLMSKIKAAKQARESAKKMQQMMLPNDQQYPTI